MKENQTIELIRTTRCYLDYLEQHIIYIVDAHAWVKAKLKRINIKDVDWDIVEEQVNNHDLSKLGSNELTQYRDKFYYEEKANSYDKTKVNENFQDACTNHKYSNSHHWETIVDETDMIIMIIDWTAMSYVNGGSAKEWYEKSEVMKFTNSERLFIEKILNELGK